MRQGSQCLEANTRCLRKNFRLTHFASIKIVFPVLFPTGVNTGNSVRWTERTRLLVFIALRLAAQQRTLLIGHPNFFNCGEEVSFSDPQRICKLPSGHDALGEVRRKAYGLRDSAWHLKGPTYTHIM